MEPVIISVQFAQDVMQEHVKLQTMMLSCLYGVVVLGSD